MTDPIAHRGPDADGHWANAEQGLVLGHRRLSIIDLSPAGAQPMISATGRFVIVFNGEIYNFRTLRDELAQAGASFRGGSDTEVLLAGFEAWGIGATIRRAAGMFALAVWDREQRTLSLARDRIGEKPLYVASGPQGLLFGSELKAMTVHRDRDWSVNSRAVEAVLRYGYVPAPMCIYQCAYKVLPGEILGFVSSRAEPTRDQYWTPGTMAKRAKAAAFVGTETEAVDALDLLLRRVVREEMESDVPLGAFLSGGIDSSLITAVMQTQSQRPIRTFTVGFEDAGFNEAHFARDVARHLGTSHTEVVLRQDAALGFVEQLPVAFDEPFADSSQLPTMLVSSITRRHVTVALSGDGGDEMFGGYTQYREGRDTMARTVSQTPRMLRWLTVGVLASLPRSIRSRMLDAFRSADGERSDAFDARLMSALAGADPQLQYEDSLSIWPDMSRILPSARHSTRLRTAAHWLAKASPSEQRMLHDLQTYLPDDICVKVDRAGMLMSLETRAPLLHHDIVEFAWSLPLHHKIIGDEGKLILRDLLSRYVPRSLFERPKRGFSVPLGSWLRGPLRAWGDDLIGPSLEALGIDLSTARAEWRTHQQGTGDCSRRLWPLLMLALWQRSIR